MKAAVTRRVRCAIYTRKSAEEGLSQSFNSLDAQREACEAYVASQVGEGWKALADRYDDGGYSGGSMERPALTRLLDDIARSRVDVVVVYKVDRLTRSLADFAKIVEAFDQKSVSFVSVTQSFSTATSMGRLTLNVLLSFAQFERELTGERIRDKIAASKARGMWMGGALPLGYDSPVDPTTRALVVNEEEAALVRMMFSKYLELGSVEALRALLDVEGVRSKLRRARSGGTLGGLRFSRGALFHLLKNRTYLGEIPHRERSYPGAHPAIVDQETFGRVQALLATQTRRGRSSGGRVAPMPLKGLIFDAAGAPMTPSHTHGRRGHLHRYYVSRSARCEDDDRAIRRVPARQIEALVQGAVSRLVGRTEATIQDHVARVEIHPEAVHVLLLQSSLPGAARHPSDQLSLLRERTSVEEEISADRDDALIRLTISCRMKFTGGAVRILDASGRAHEDARRQDDTLIAALKSAHHLLAGSRPEWLGKPESAALADAPANPYQRSLIRLAFLAPDIQAAILEGRQPVGLNRQRLILGDIPLAWEDQRRLFAMA
jgi:DNA invertase Pin-like site-specific DNA recombinase